TYLEYHEDHAHLRISSRTIAQMFPASSYPDVTLAWYERLMNLPDKQDDPIVQLTNEVVLPVRGAAQPKIYSANPSVLQFFAGALPMITNVGDALVVCTDHRRIRAVCQLSVSVADGKLRIIVRDAGDVIVDLDLDKSFVPQNVEILGRTFHISANRTLNIL